jgi:hypothetical protein
LREHGHDENVRVEVVRGAIFGAQDCFDRRTKRVRGAQLEVASNSATLAPSNPLEVNDPQYQERDRTLLDCRPQCSAEAAYAVKRA